MTKHKPRQQYLSYLLRLWQSGSGEGQVWRTSLQRPGSEERQGFADLEELMDFLKTQIKQGNGEIC